MARDWPTNHDDHVRMKHRQVKSRANTDPADVWMQRFLIRQTGVKWTPRAQWGYRLFDFWCHRLGVAVELATDDADADQESDRAAYDRSAILVVRVRGFNADDAAHAVDIIKQATSWNERRAKCGMARIWGAD
jgi:hypothetical protein